MPKHVNFLFCTDRYNDGSIQHIGREHHGSSEKCVYGPAGHYNKWLKSESESDHLIGGQLNTRPADWKDFLMNSENKSQLTAVMNEVWYADAFAHKLQNRKIVSVVQGHFYLLESDDKRQTPELFCIVQMPKSMVMRQYVSVVQIIIFPSSSYIMLQSLTSESSLTLVLGTTEIS